MIETRNEEAGFIEFLNDDVATIVREIDAPCAILLDMNTRQVVGYRVYDPAPTNNLKAERTLTAYEMQVLIGTTVSGCNMPPDRVFDLTAAWNRLHSLGLIDRADGLAIATASGEARVISALQSLSTQQPMGEVTDEMVVRFMKAEDEFHRGKEMSYRDHGVRAALISALHPNQESGE